MTTVSIKSGKRKLTAEQETALVEAYAIGIDTKILAERFGIDVTTVRRYGRRSGAFRGPKPMPLPEPQSADEQERDRIERLTAYDRRSVTGVVCGDPPSGFSALEQRNHRHD